MESAQKQLDRIIEAYCLQAKYVERLEKAAAELLAACEAVKKVFWMIGSGVHVAGTLPAAIRGIEKNLDAAIAKAKPAPANKGKGGTIGGDRDSVSKREKGKVCGGCKHKYGYKAFVCRSCTRSAFGKVSVDRYEKRGGK